MAFEPGALQGSGFQASMRFDFAVFREWVIFILVCGGSP